MKLTNKKRKKFRIRNKLKKVSKQDRFRLSIHRSARNISAQIIDDSKNITLISATSNEKKKKLQKFILIVDCINITVELNHLQIH